MKFLYNNTSQKELRRKLRQEATPEENLLWQIVRGKKLGCKFYRQASIGPYIVDFYCSEHRLIIELDGAQHLDNRNYDEKRTDYFKILNCKVIRFSNSEIKNNLDGVILKIQEAVKS